MERKPERNASPRAIVLPGIADRDKDAGTTNTHLAERYESNIQKGSLMQQRRFIQVAVVACFIAATAFSAEAEQPNVVIVITDDQGYGDVAFAVTLLVQLAMAAGP